MSYGYRIFKTKYIVLLYYRSCVGVTEEPESWACGHCQTPKKEKADQAHTL